MADREGDHGRLVGDGLGMGDDAAAGDDGEHCWIAEGF